MSQGASASGVARAWVESLPAGTWFRTAAVPGPGHVVRNVLSRLMADERPIIGRAARSVYWRQPPPRDALYGVMPLLTHQAHAVLASPGSGYADMCALFHVGWCRQMPVRTTIAVPYRNVIAPQIPGKPPIVYAERLNTRRRLLNWNEATLLEAARASVFADYHSWDHAMSYLEGSDGWMKRAEPIRREMLMWAAAAEPRSRSSSFGDSEKHLDSVLRRLERDLPDVLAAP